LVTLWVIFDGELIALSHQIKPDVLIHMLSIAMMIKLFNYIDNKSTSNLYLASFIIGIMLSTQYITLPAFFVPIIVFFIKKTDFRVILNSYLIIFLTFFIVNFQIFFNLKDFITSVNELRYIASNYGDFKELGLLQHLKYNLYINDIFPITGILFASGFVIAVIRKKLNKKTTLLVIYALTTIFIQGLSERSMLVAKYSLFASCLLWVFIGYFLELKQLIFFYIFGIFIHVLYPYTFLKSIQGVDSRETARRYIE
ncbi:MAG: hypothetical protein NZ870_04970, partial [bacterium]|nr:hypothetical protein [bacterium]